MNSHALRPKSPAATQVLAVLRYVAGQAGPVSASIIARDVGLPRSTTYQLIASLIDDGFLVHLPEERKYALGVTAHELGTGYSRQAPIQRIARHPLSRLVARTRRTAHLAVMHGRDVVYVIEERAPRQRPLVTDTGVRLPAHLTASGRAMMAQMDPSQVAALFPGPEAFAERHSNGPQSLPALQDLLARARSLGYAWEQDEVTEGFSSVAVAVLDRQRYPVASVTLTVSNRAFPGGTRRRDQDSETAEERAIRIEDLAREWVPEVTRCAREISRRLGTQA
ncbi:MULTISPECIES: IclR family transcriptional regulator [Arthrobacter]|uniref:IclR family transcriptional regulator n=1 Tax=Arthrobacter terricola TaxID=2547396 RepID=A0A4R5KT99_9MICC|nr:MULTISPECIES: IclR family transcriptional regulator [Arthrobacter]MBT8159841.1 IclR family transcriptional regulator [Arthrobacter sp. GN70]TDF99071.1 IclR family transcriptional regulator [Arthrobacter terricola]